MQLFKVTCAGLIASALFWLIDQMLLSLDYRFQIGGMVALFILGAVGFWIIGGDGSKRIRLMSNSIFRKDLDVIMEENTIEGAEGVDLLSDNKVEGKTKIDITKTKIKG